MLGMPERDDQPTSEAPLENWAPRLGQLTIGEAAVYAETMRTLARTLMRAPIRFGEASLCLRIAIWLDRELAKLDPLTIIDRERDLLPVPRRLTALAPSIAGMTNRMKRSSSNEDLSKDLKYGLLAICQRLIVSVGSHGATRALLELADAALDRSLEHEEVPIAEIETAITCYEQLVNDPDPSMRVHALYGAAQAHLASGEADGLPTFVAEECVIAGELLQAAIQVIGDPHVLAFDVHGNQLTCEKITELLARVTTRLAAASQEITSSNVPGNIEGVS